MLSPISQMQTVEVVKDQFVWCQQNEEGTLATKVGYVDKCMKHDVRYYIRSAGPGYAGSHSSTFELLVSEAMTHWSGVTGVNVKRVKDKGKCDFIVRCANQDEETEKPNLIADAFCWSHSPVTHVLQIWASFWNYKPFQRVAILVHEIGHILGFRHEHVFIGAEARIGNMKSSATSADLLLMQEIVDENSIMSYGHLNKILSSDENCHKFLSETDLKVAKAWYFGDDNNKSEKVDDGGDESPGTCHTHKANTGKPRI